MNSFLDGSYELDMMNDKFAFMGRLLFLCQEFESSMKFVISVFLFKEKGITSETNFQSMVDFFKKHSKKFMGQLIKQSQNMFNENDKSVLHSAILARNFICHEFFAHIGTYANTRPFMHTKEFKDIVSDLALGSYIIMSIEYSITEKEPFFIKKERYIDHFLRFVFSNKYLI